MSTQTFDRLVFVDCETEGPCPGYAPIHGQDHIGWRRLGQLHEFGAVHYTTRETFHGVLTAERAARREIPQPWMPPDMVFTNFAAWLVKVLPKSKGQDPQLPSSETPILVSDNPAWDFMWIQHGMWLHLGSNPFGHSARRISDFYAGLTGDFTNSQEWKRLRRTKHDHHPVHDALGNCEGFERMLKGERGPRGRRGKSGVIVCTTDDMNP